MRYIPPFRPQEMQWVVTLAFWHDWRPLHLSPSTEFVLSEAGDVTWSVTDSCDSLPLFSCQMYELYTYQNLHSYGNRTLLRFAAYNGHIIEFRVRMFALLIYIVSSFASLIHLQSSISLVNCGKLSTCFYILSFLSHLYFRGRFEGFSPCLLANSIELQGDCLAN